MRLFLVLAVMCMSAAVSVVAQTQLRQPPILSATVQQVVQVQRPTTSLHLPLRDGTWRSCELALRSNDNSGVVTTMTTDGPRTSVATERWVTYHGTTVDGGTAVVTYHTSGELRATIIYADSVCTVASANDRPLNPTYRVHMGAVGAFGCSTPEALPTSAVVRAVAEAQKHPEQTQQLDTITVRVAVEVDYDMVTAIRSVSGTETYVANVLAVMSTVYENEVRARLVLSNLRIWERNNDPYPTDMSVFELLDVFADEYEAKMTQIPRDLAMFLTMRGGLGGIARTIGGLCESGNSYCAGDVLQTIKNYPTWSWDVGMLTHEIGHLAGAIHTQSCFWPGGPLDSCITSESGTCVKSDQVRPTRGTIMSYCHQLLDRGASMALEFHSLHRRIVRSFLERASCLGNMPLPRTQRISGVVRDADTRQPLANLALRITPMSTAIYRGMPEVDGPTMTTTDAEGRYQFTGLGTGLYEIIVKGPYATSVGSSNRRNAVMVADSVVTYNMDLINVVEFDIRLRNTDDLSLSLSIYSDALSETLYDVTIPAAPYGDTSDTRSYLMRVRRGTYHIIPSIKDGRFTPREIVVTAAPTPTDSVPVIASFECTQRKLTTSVVSFGYARLREAVVGAQAVLTGGRPWTIRGGTTQDIIREGTCDVDGVTIVEDLPSELFLTFEIDGDTSTFAPFSERTWLAPSYTSVAGLVVNVPRRMPLVARTYSMDVRQQSYADVQNPQVIFDQSVTTQQPAAVVLPFPVRIGDRVLSTMTVYQNGFCSLNGTKLQRWVNRPIAETSLTDFIVVPFANDLLPDTNAPNPWRVAVAYLGEAPRRRVVVEWRNLMVRQWDNSQGSMANLGRFRFQAHIYEDGVIEMVYDAPEGLTGATPVFAQIGLRGGDVLDNLVLTSQTDDDLRYMERVFDRSGTSQVVLSTSQAMPSGLTYRWTPRASSVGETSSESLVVLPNPASDMIRVMHAPIGATIALVDHLGVTVRSGICESSQHALDVAGIASGSYTAVVSTPSSRSTFRVLLRR